MKMADKPILVTGGQRTSLQKRKRKMQKLKTSGVKKMNDSSQDNRVESATKKKFKWTNKQRVLIFCSRGITFRPRHLMMDLRALLPHSKPDTKLDRKDQLCVVNEVCEMKDCNKCIYFQMRKKQDLYMWVTQAPNGPSAKFLVENIHTMDELRLTGNCLKGSRPLLTFDPAFDSSPHYQLLKELFIQVFGTPLNHPKSKPFIDHVFHFAIADHRVWFRNYHIVEDGASLTEIGPRFVMNLIKIFDGSFGGPTLYENPHYMAPNVYRRLLKKKAGMRYKDRVDSRRALEERMKDWEYDEDPLEELFKAH